MGLFHKALTVNEAINESRTTPNAVLVDIRSKNAYREGYVAGSDNIPLDKAELITHRIPDRETKIYVIGSTASEPAKGVRAFKKLGYKNVVQGGFMEDHHGLLRHG